MAINHCFRIFGSVAKVFANCKSNLFAIQTCSFIEIDNKKTSLHIIIQAELVEKGFYVKSGPICIDIR